MIKNQWPSFIVNTQSLMYQLVTLGISPVVFPSERSPKWRVVELNRFFVPNQAQADLDMLTTVLIESEYTLQYLYQVYERFHKDRAKGPWNIDQLERLLVWLSGSTNRDGGMITDPYELENKILSGEFLSDRCYSDTIRLISLFQVEYDGKVTHYIFHRNTAYTADNALNEATHDFLYCQPAQFDKMSDAIVPFTLNPGEFRIHENKGIGHKIFSLAQASIISTNSVVDMLRWASTPIIKSPQMGLKEADAVRFIPGVPTNIGSAEFVQNNLGANVQNCVVGANLLESKIMKNISYSGSDPASPDPDKGSLSPDQVKVMATREYNVLKNAAQHFYKAFDQVLALMTRAMIVAKEGDPDYDLAENWKGMCIEDGVPEEVFSLAAAEEKRRKAGKPYARRVSCRATRVAGAGSQIGVLLGLQMLQPIMGSLGPREQQAAKRLTINAAFGADYVPTFTQDADRVDEEAGGASLAGLENIAMQAGKSPIFSRDNEHQSHFVIVMALLSDTIQQIQQQKIDLIQADSIFNVAVPHAGQHLKALADNPFSAAFAAQHKDAFIQVGEYANLVRRNAGKMLEAQQKQQQAQQEAQQQAMTEEQLKTMQVVNDEKRKDMKLQAQTQRQEAAGQAKESALRRKVEGELQIKKAKVDGENAIARSKAITENTADSQAAANPGGYIADMNGQTPAPFDIEGVPRI